MKRTVLKSLIGITLLAAFSAIPAFSAQRPLAAGGTTVVAPVERVDLSESSRASSEVANFLAQPALSEALAKARADKNSAAEATQNPSGYLSRNGVRVPANMQVEIQPPTGGSAAKVGITITIRCCPPSITIVIRL